MSLRPPPTSERSPGPAPRAPLREALRPWVERALALPAPPPGLELSAGASAGYLRMVTGRALQLLGPQLVAHWRAARACRPHLGTWEFGQALATGGLDSLLRGLPLLADCLHQALAGARTAWIELLECLQRDLPALVEAGCLRPAAGPLRLARVRGPFSDFHGRRTALRLDFGPAGSVIFKPRDSRVEDILQNLAQHILPTAGQWPARLARPDAGWVRWIERDPLSAAAGRSEALAEQLGGILCFAQIFRISDLHQGNLLVSGGVIVPVDLETAFHPHPVQPEWIDAHTGRAVDLRDSVLHPGMLSVETVDGERGRIANFAVLGRWARQRFPVPRQELHDPSDPTDPADGPTMREVQGWTVNRFAALWSAGESASERNIAAIVRGYESARSRALARREDLAQAAASLAGLPVRELSRNTCFYGLLIDQFLASPYEETCAEIAAELARVPVTGAIPAARQEQEMRSVGAAEAPRFRRVLEPAEIDFAFSTARRLWDHAGADQPGSELAAWLRQPPRLTRPC